MKYEERKDYNKVITIKLEIPSGCNANCVFCYMKEYPNKCYNHRIFLDNFIDSLNFLVKEIGNKNEISLDITGNEPTLNKDLLKSVLLKLKEYNIKSKVLRTTITTNGANLKDLIPYFEGVIDYVNISIHHYDKLKRDNIFKINTLSDNEYKNCIKGLNKIGITASAVCVIYKPIKNFKIFMDNFIKWCEDIGFISLRFRNDVFWKETEFDDYMNIALHDEQFTIINHENTTDSHWCRLRKYNKFRVFFLHGVKDTSILTKGIEYVIADDGKVYCDFYKQKPIEKYEYEIGKIYDLKK